MINTKIYQIANKMYLEGQNDENYIMQALIDSIGGTCIRASKEDDVLNHIDFWWTTPKGIEIGIDAKGLHKNKRKDKSYSNNHWIEVKNVQGKLGWIYSKAKYIAFRTVDNILFVEPQRLIDLYANLVSHKETVHIIPSLHYIPYQRKDRNDLIFKVPDSFLEQISSFIIKLC